MQLMYFLLCVCVMHSCIIFVVRADGASGCPEPPTPINGFVYPSEDDDTKVVFGCHSSYRARGRTESTCICNQYGCSWSVPPPVCEPARAGGSCTQPQAPESGYIMRSEGGLQEGAEVTYGCNEGFTLQGEETSRCDCGGSQCVWTLTPTCQRERVSTDGTCTDPREIVDGYIVRREGGIRPGDTTTYRCHDEFTLQGDDTSICDCSGSECAWTTRPTCERERAVTDQSDSTRQDCPKTTERSCHCGNPGTPTNVCSRIVHVSGFCDKIVYFCKPGYRLEGSGTYQCPVFGFNRPRCVADGCPVPDNVANGRYSPAHQSYRSGDHIRYTCNTGFRTMGAATRRCDGTRWSPLERTFCGPVPCGNPSMSQNLMRVDRGGTMFGAVARFQCREGYNLIGEASRTCQADRSWSGSTPRCERISCGYPGAPVNGRVLDHSWREQTYDYNSMLQFTCERRFKLVGASRITCRANGQWSPPLPECQAVTCPMEYLEERLFVTESQRQVDGGGYLVDASLDFRCDEGYRLQGASSVVCQQNGRWTYRFPSCDIVTCGTAAAPAHGQMVGRSFTYGSVVIFSCDQGYNLRGSSRLQCQANGRWDGTLPACMENGCGALGSPTNGRVQALGVGIGSTSVFSCDDDHELIGESVATCTSEGWDNPPPRCHEIRCPTPNRILNGRVEGEDFTIGGEIRFYCDEHYTLVGSETNVCNSAGRWSHAYPICQVQECSPPANPTHGITTAPSLELESIATFMCFRGYTLSGDSTTQCMSSKRWSNPMPTCTPCPVGTYKDSTSNTECMQCPDGSSTATLASTSRFQCICQGGTTGYAGGPCIDSQCERPSAPENGVITDCGVTQNGRCNVECSPGYVVRGSRVRTCFNNEWLPRDNLPTCHACPEDTYSTGGSRTSCQLCPARSHTNGTTAATSIDSCVCSAGYRRNHLNGLCEDINECAVGNGNCTGRGAECYNTQGSSNCRCSVPGSKLDSTGKNCFIEQSCEDLTDEPKNGQLRCVGSEDYNSNTCHIFCNKGYFFVSGNNYVTCGETTNWTYTHQLRNRTAELPSCMEEFFIDTLFNLTTTLNVASPCDSYTGNLQAEYNINAVLHEKGDCSAYRCSTRPEEIFMKCSDTGTGVSQLQLNFSVYLENPEDGRLTDDCERTCQFERLRDMIKATGRIWMNAQRFFKGDFGEVDTDSGATISLTVVEVEASRPDVRCHEPGRVFTEKKMCVPCSTGYYLANRTDRRCSPCPVGQYQDQTGQTRCTICPDGLTTLTSGASSSDMCITQGRVDIIVAGLNNGDVTLADK